MIVNVQYVQDVSDSSLFYPPITFKVRHKQYTTPPYLPNLAPLRPHEPGHTSLRDDMYTGRGRAGYQRDGSEDSSRVRQVLQDRLLSNRGKNIGKTDRRSERFNGDSSQMPKPKIEAVEPVKQVSSRLQWHWRSTGALLR